MPSSLDKAISDAMSGKKLTDVVETFLNTPSETQAGLILDKIMQKVNMANLLDFFQGTEIYNEADEVRLYFSPSTTYEMLEPFIEQLQSVSQEIGIYDSDKEDSRWIVLLKDLRKDKDPKMKGQVKAGVALQGTTDVGSPSTGNQGASNGSLSSV